MFAPTPPPLPPPAAPPPAPPPTTTGKRLVAVLSGGHRHVYLFPAGTEAAVLARINRQAADPRHPLTPADAAALAGPVAARPPARDGAAV